MPFEVRVTYVDTPKPTRAYFYDSPTARLADVFKDTEEAILHLDRDLRENEKMMEETVFLIPFVWGFDGVKISEIIGYAEIDLNDWPGPNPEKHVWVFENGEYKPSITRIGCGDASIVLGEEEKHRRKTKGLTEYMERRPDLGGLPPYVGDLNPKSDLQVSTSEGRIRIFEKTP